MQLSQQRSGGLQLNQTLLGGQHSFSAYRFFSEIHEAKVKPWERRSESHHNNLDKSIKNVWWFWSICDWLGNVSVTGSLGAITDSLEAVDASVLVHIIVGGRRGVCLRSLDQNKGQDRQCVGGALYQGAAGSQATKAAKEWVTAAGTISGEELE